MTTTTPAAFPTALYDACVPMQQLTYDWTSVLPHFSQHTNAEVSWQHGVARIPKQWDITLQAPDFDLRMPDGSPVDLPERAAGIYCQTLHQIEKHFFSTPHQLVSSSTPG